MKILLAAITSLTGNVQKNKDRMIALMQKNSDKADMLLFGEAFLQGFYSMDFHYPHDIQLALPLDSPIVNEIKEAAKANGTGVSFGMLERDNENIYSSQITISSQGDMIDVFHRVSPGWKEESANECYLEGNNFHCFEYMNKKIAVGLCGDLWFEEKVSEISALAPDIVFWPVYTDYAADEWNASVKYEYCEQAKKVCRKVLYVNSVCIDQVGDEIAKGGSALFGNGEILLETPSGEESELLVDLKAFPGNGIEIKTKRLQLKPLGLCYLNTVNAYAMDTENTRYMCYLPNKTVEETMEFLKNVENEWQKEEQKSFEFAILYEGQHVGAVSLYVENGVGELGWIVNKAYWRNGFASEAAEAVINYFVENRNVKHFMAHCDTENTASYKVMEKLGMVRTGEWGGRRNRFAVQESREYRYELELAED